MRENVLGLALVTAGFAVGIASVLMAVFVFDEADRNAVLLQSLGEALVVGTLVGATVDFVARRTFAREVGRNVFLTLFGRNVPDHYTEGLQPILRASRISYEVDTEISFGWHTPGDLLRLDLVQRARQENISDRPLPESNLWIMRSALGAPGSRLQSYEASSFVRDRSGQRVGHIALSEQELRSRTRDNADGSQTVALRDLPGALELPPGGVRSYITRGVTYQRTTAVFPIVRGEPVLRHRVVLAGPALPYIQVEVRRGFEIARANREGDRYAYTFDSLAVGGMTILVQWQPLG